MAKMSWPHSARSIIEMEGDGVFRFTIFSDVSGVVCGIRGLGSVSGPDDLTHAVMVMGREMCVVEGGKQVTPWLAAPAGFSQPSHWTFAIYRVNGRVLYTVGEGSRSGDYMYEERSQFHTWRNVEVRGNVLHESRSISTGAVCLGTFMSDAASDTAVLNAVLLPAEQLSAKVQARAPAWRTKVSNQVASRADLVLPHWRVAASDLSDNRVRARLVQWRAAAGQSAYDVPRNDITAKLPAWRTEAPQMRSNPIRVPLWRARAQGPNRVAAKASRWRAHGGDAINLLQVRLPAWRARSMAPSDLSGMAYGQVVLPVMLQPFSVSNDGSLATRGMHLMLGGQAEALTSAKLDTAQMVLHLGGAARTSADIALPTLPLVLRLGGDGRAYATGTLPAQSMALKLGGAISVQSDALLAVRPMALVLGGTMSALRGEGAEVFVLNMTGGDPGGSTQYKDYEFNSYARIGDKHYGVNEEGLFLLEGEQDEGRAIAARFGLGQLDFGSPQLKTVSYCYLGAAAGAMTLQVDALLAGRPASFTYPARGHGQSMRELRFDLGRGLRSTYVVPTFANKDGEAFALDAIRFVVNESARRI